MRNVEAVRRAKRNYLLRHPERRKETIDRYYESHKDAILERAAEYRAANSEKRAEIRRRYNERRQGEPRWNKTVNAFFMRAAKTEGCVDCGEKDPVVLDFDHVRGEKVDIISHMYAAALPRLLNEISKCDVRCANCHRRITARRRVAA